MKRNLSVSLSEKDITPPLKRRCAGIRNSAAISLGFEQEAVNLGTETESEMHMKSLLEKQLDTNITLKDQFAQHRTFTSPCTFTPLTAMVRGTCSLENYKNLEDGEERNQQLQNCGLTKDEIDFFLFCSEPEYPSRNGVSMDPQMRKQKLDQIQEKISSHERELEKCETFSKAKVLGRHAMDVEKSLYAGCESKKQLGFLIKEKNGDTISPNDPFSHVKKIADEISQKIRRERRKKKRKQRPSVITESEPLPAHEVTIEYDPSIHHVVVPFEPEQIAKNKLTADQIRELPRFGNYNPGEPNKILYLKNLPYKVTVRDLQAIFGIFQIDSPNSVNYRLLSGRLRGQAFISFNDKETAVKAFHYANGYQLHNRPIIIEYGRKH